MLEAWSRYFRLLLYQTDYIYILLYYIRIIQNSSLRDNCRRVHIDRTACYQALQSDERQVPERISKEVHRNHCIVHSCPLHRASDQFVGCCHINLCCFSIGAMQLLLMQILEINLDFNWVPSIATFLSVYLPDSGTHRTWPMTTIATRRSATK